MALLIDASAAGGFWGRWSKEAAAKCQNHERRSSHRSESLEQPQVEERSAELRPRHRRFRRVVLLRTAPRVQSHRGPPIPDLSRAETLRADNDQSAPGGRSAGRLRGRRFRTAQSRTGTTNPTRQGVRRIGIRAGNWLTVEQGKRLPATSESDSLRGKRNYAILAMLIGCGLRRGELLALCVDAIQLREEHYVIADLLGKAGHIRTIPIPAWVKAAVDAWMDASGITEGTLFRSINKAGKVWGNGMTRRFCRRSSARAPRVRVLTSSPRTILGALARGSATWPAASWIRSNSC